MNQNQFETINSEAGRPSTLEAYAQTSSEQAQLGNSPPDGGPWTDSKGKDLGFVIVRTKPRTRVAYRNWCEWEELTLPDGSTGIYVHAHASAASRF